jgi:uncharacterized protein (DUF58 family)
MIGKPAIGRSEIGQLCVVRSLWPPAAAAAGLFGFAYVTHAVWPQLLACALVGLIIASLLGIVRPASVTVDVELPDRVVVGRPFETVLRITHAGSGPSHPLVVRHRILVGRRYVPNYAAMVGALAGHESVVVRAGRTPVTRGVVERSQLEVDAIAPFGFFSRRTVIPLHDPILVLPALAPAVVLPVAPGTQAGTVDRTQGMDAGAVRDWRPGDAVRNVQWRSTARTGRLTVLEREDVAAGALVILVVGRSGDPAFEAVVATACATAVTALHQGQAVVVVTAKSEIRCTQLRTEGALLEFFARINAAEPVSEPLLHSIFGYSGNPGYLGRGASLLLAAAPSVPSVPSVPAGWRESADRIAVGAGIRIVDLGRRL